MDWNPPTHCGRGHELKPPNVVVNWTPCQCSKATGSPRGHEQVRCWPCRTWVWRKHGCDHVVDGVVRESGPETHGVQL